MMSYAAIWINAELFKMIVGLQLSSDNSAPIRETTTIWQFHSKAVCTVSRDRVRVYPGTEGTNQNRHWNHRRWYAERTHVDVCRITKAAHTEHLYGM